MKFFPMLAISTMLLCRTISINFANVTGSMESEDSLPQDNLPQAYYTVFSRIDVPTGQKDLWYGYAGANNRFKVEAKNNTTELSNK